MEIDPKDAVDTLDGIAEQRRRVARRAAGPRWDVAWVHNREAQP